MALGMWHFRFIYFAESFFQMKYEQPIPFKNCPHFHWVIFFLFLFSPLCQASPQKQHQYYSPQVRRKSVDLTLLQNIRECHETSDSSDEDQTILVASDQLSALSVVHNHQHHQQKKAGNSNVNLMQQHPMLHAKSSKSRQISSQQPAYYGGVHPVYLPNSRLKAKKLQKMPPPMTSTVLPDYPGINTNCQGCCQHHSSGNTCCSLSNSVKSGEDNKKCIISWVLNMNYYCYY